MTWGCHPLACSQAPDFYRQWLSLAGYTLVSQQSPPDLSLSPPTTMWISPLVGRTTSPLCKGRAQQGPLRAYPLCKTPAGRSLVQTLWRGTDRGVYAVLLCSLPVMGRQVLISPQKGQYTNSAPRGAPFCAEGFFSSPQKGAFYQPNFVAYSDLAG